MLRVCERAEGLHTQGRGGRQVGGASGDWGEHNTSFGKTSKKMMSGLYLIQYRRFQKQWPDQICV